MQSSFKSIVLASNRNNVNVGWFIRLLPEKYYKNYLLKKLPINIENVNYIQEQGENIVLPITKEDLESWDNEFLSELITNIVNRYEINYYRIPDKLQKYVKEETKRDRIDIIKYLILDHIIEKAIKIKNLTFKSLKLILIDSGDDKIFSVLEPLIDQLNYLVIVTDRVEYFHEFREMIYVNTGLVVDIVNNPLEDHIEGNMIIDLNSNLYKNYFYYPKKCVVIDLASNKQKLNHLFVKRKDLKVIYDVVVSARGTVVENHLLNEIICNKNPRFKDFINYGQNHYSVSEWSQIVNEYQIYLKELILIG